MRIYPSQKEIVREMMAIDAGRDPYEWDGEEIEEVGDPFERIDPLEWPERP